MPRRASARSPRAPSPGLGAKRAALAATAALSLLLVAALVARAMTPPPVAPPPRIELDEPAELTRADGLAAAGHRLAVQGRDARRSDRLVEALATYDEAASLYTELLDRHPGEGYDWVAARLDRLTLEKQAVRKLLLELGR